MNNQSQKKIWICPEDAGTYMIPANAALSEGNVTLISIDGDEIRVDQGTIESYRLEEEEVHALFLDQAKANIDQVKDTVSGIADKAEEADEKELASLFASILDNQNTEKFSMEDWQILRQHIENGEFQSAVGQMSGAIREIINELGPENAGNPDLLLPALVDWAIKGSSKPQDWQKLKNRIKSSIDRRL